MNRSVLAAGVLALAMTAGGMMSAASAQGAKTSEPAERWKAGEHYVVLATPQKPEVARDKVEVNEYFWYGCGHCYSLDPTLESWKLSKPAYIEFARVPVVWGPGHRQHARLFYTLKALDRMDLHPKVFDAIHLQGNILAAGSEEDGRAIQQAFLKQHGVSQAEFDAAYDSKAVADDVARAERLTNTFRVGSVPMIIINGKFSTGVSQAGGSTQLLELINDLAAGEKRR